MKNPKDINILIACEESQAICKEFRKRGFTAFSCDILDCSGGHPEWHIKGDAIPLLNGFCAFETMTGDSFILDTRWDMIIAHPPCTYLTNTGNRWFNIEKYGDKATKRIGKREDAINFFYHFASAKCNHIAIENPIGCMSTRFRKPDCIVHPFMFGESERKATCWWLTNLPVLEPTEIVEPIIIKYKNGKGSDSPWHMETMKLPPDERARARSKTFPGMAKAIAEQWGNYLMKA